MLKVSWPSTRTLSSLPSNSNCQPYSPAHVRLPVVDAVVTYKVLRLFTAQLDGHRKLLVIQEEYLKVSQNRGHLSVGKLARGMINEHIDHLGMLKV